MAAEEAALRAVEAAQDAEGARRACRFRLVLLTGDLAKGLTGGRACGIGDIPLARTSCQLPGPFLIAALIPPRPLPQAAPSLAAACQR